MMIVNMNNIRPVIPGSQPIDHGDLERGESFGVIVVSINFFPVQQPININQVKIKSELISAFLNNRIIEPPVAQMGITLMYSFPFVLH
jgi:hypothetical protein